MIAIDYDGVIANTNAIKAEWIRDYLGKRIPPYFCDRTSCVPLIGIELYNQMSKEVYGETLSLKAKPVFNIENSIDILSQYGPLYVITARNTNNIEYAKKWLVQHELASYICDVISMGTSNKISLALSLECKVLIDDDQRHLLKEHNQNILNILLKIGLEDYPTNNLSFTLCKTWEDTITTIKMYLHR